ncbi:MAG: glycosyltransferase [Acidobacteria bacterium]|nr:glycosyltransferase [Acidobacteriota bacterium]
MKTVHLGVDLEPKTGGTYRSVLNFQSSLSRLGVEVDICSFSPGPSPVATPGVAQVPTSRKFPGKPYYFWSGCYSGRLRGILTGADIVFLHGLYIHPFVHAALWSRRNQVPYVVVPHGSLDPWVFSYRRYRKQAWLRLYRRLMLEDASSVVFASARERDKAAGLPAIARPDVINWPVASVADFDKTSAGQRVRLDCGLPNRCRVALFCGRLHPMKRPIETIELFLRTAPRDWVLLLVGPASAEIPETKMASICGASGGRCRYLGPVFGDRLSDFYKAADLLVLISHRENFSYTVTEALACGVPVLVSNGVDLSADIAREGCGFVVDNPADGQTLEKAFDSSLRCDSASLASMGARGRRWVRRDLSEERFSTRLEALCDSIVRRAGSVRS